MRSVAVVGGSLAGLSAVRALRGRGFDGAITVVAQETGAPYDRPPLSKGFLAGTVARDELALLGTDEDLHVTWRDGTRAVALRPGNGSVELDDGSSLAVDGVVLATGARPRVPWQALPPGVHVLRTLADATDLRAELVPGARLVVVGAGFIGAEVASTAKTAGLDVTVVEAAHEPLAVQLGALLGATVAGLHARHDVRLLTGAPVTGFVTGERVEGVHLADGRIVPADVVLVGVGVIANVEWLADAGLGDVTGGVRCDAFGRTTVPNVVAVGDCSQWWDDATGRHRRVEHWAVARERATTAVASLLSGGREQQASRPPYFWSDQYGHRLQSVGDLTSADEVVIEEGALTDLEFLAVHRRGGVPVGVVALGCARSFMRWRKQLAARAVTPAGVGR